MARVLEIAAGRPRADPQWETREVTMPRGTSRQQARQLLTEYAEYGHWELARLRLYPDGRRWALLRRRMLRVPRPILVTISGE